VPYEWGPHYIVPSEALKTYSGVVRLREELDDDLLKKTLDKLGLSGVVTRITNPWYYRKEGGNTWVKIGESGDRAENFPVTWNTSQLENGRYEVLGLMHVFIRREDGEHVIAGQNVVEVTVKN
jgi:hypothetical protein